MHQTREIVRETIVLVVFAGVVGWVLIRSLKRSEAPRVLIVKWILSALLVGFMLREVGPLAWSNPLVGVPFTAVCGVVFTLLWRRSIASMIAKPFGALYDGGDQEIEPRPLYSIAQTKRKQGRYTEALREMRKQLDKFPRDFEGQLTLAEIQAENLNDLPGAEITIQRLCSQPGHAPGNIALALNSLADWHLKFAQDREAARQALERVGALLPGSEMAALAALRIAHLGQTGFLLDLHDPKRIAVPSMAADLGLPGGGPQPQAPEADPAKEAVELVKHLEQHPLDTEAREKLATLYADHYQRLDLAADQIEEMIAHANHPPRSVVHWLNLLADLQIRHSTDPETVRSTVQRIIDLYPGSAAAYAARNRLDRLNLEFKARQKSRDVKLGSYEQDIGLKRGSPHQL